MRFEYDIEKSLTQVFDNEGKLYYEENACAAYFDVHQAIIGNETLAQLEAIIKKEGAAFPVDREFAFCEKFYVLCTFDVLRWNGGEIKFQQALRDIIKAFKAMDCMDRATLLEAYMREADLRPLKSDQICLTTRSDPASCSIQVWLNSKPESFLKAAKSLLIGGRGRGEAISFESVLKRRLFVLGYELFLSLGLTPTLANGGFFGKFMRALYEDPALKSLPRLPDNIKKLIKEAEKTVEREAKKANSRGVLKDPF